VTRQVEQVAGQLVLPVFGPSVVKDGYPQCSAWTTAHVPCGRRATVAADGHPGRHNGLCSQHDAMLRSGRLS
jgi:hypothetical protein